MITANADTPALVERLKQRAGRWARHRSSSSVSLTRNSPRTDWHSPASLWPDIELD